MHITVMQRRRRADMKEALNQQIKKREPFRPFAPSILLEHVGDYFEQTFGVTSWIVLWSRGDDDPRIHTKAHESVV